MALSKEARIKIFIGIDLAFFLLEIVVGYYAHSLALVADAFHMVATTRGSSDSMTYGWARAEILGGLINGVFLVALCLSIFIQAIERFFEPQEVSNPKLVLVVGGVGLAFNILGLFVFHQHSHDHGHDHGHDHDHAHSHIHEDELEAAENGHAHSHVKHYGTHQHGHAGESSGDSGSSGATKVTGITWNIPPQPQNGEASDAKKPRLSISSARRAGSVSSRIEDLPISPRIYREDIMNMARMQGEEEDDSGSALDDTDDQEDSGSPDTAVEDNPTETTPVLISHSGHRHNLPRKKVKSGGHSHDDMNIRGMFLHFLGDALGNVGVMATALIIWLAAPWKPRFYFDPAISLVITAIILKTAIPLCKETSKPLLQAVPEDVSVEAITADIESLPGIKKCRHLHVWALTPMKRIATLDVIMDFGYDPERYSKLIKEIKTCLHAYGIHNSTVQPQFSDTPLIGSLECGNGEEQDLKCCTPTNSSNPATLIDQHDSHDHAHGHDHDH